MNIADIRALVTGATGGIGRELAKELHARGASVLLVGRDVQALRSLLLDLDGPAPKSICVADVTTSSGRACIVERAVTFLGPGVNLLVNNAGLGEFTMVEDQSPLDLEPLFAVNVLAPMHIARALLPHLRAQREAAVLNIGSVFGSLAYPGFAAYSASKFALRGYTEALRRELLDTPVKVHYLAPRSTRTAMNGVEIELMNAELGVAMDPPELVARAACDMLEGGKLEAVLGWPERFFVRINALLPRLVDGSLRKQLPVIRRHAQSAATQRLT